MVAVGSVACSAVERVAYGPDYRRGGRDGDHQVHLMFLDVLLYVVVGYPRLHQAVPQFFIDMDNLVHGL